MTQRQADSYVSAMPRDELEEKTCELVQYLLIQENRKQPFKSADIKKHVLKEHSKGFPSIIEKAREKLLDVYGLDLVRIPDKSNHYALINSYENIDEKGDSYLKWSEEDTTKMGLFTVVLSFIFMKGNSVREDELYQFLHNIGVSEHNVDIKELFGDVKKLLSQEAVRQGYLATVREQDSDPPKLIYSWGWRSKLETSKRKMLDFVCKIFKIEDPSLWTNQYKELQEEEHAATNI